VPQRALALHLLTESVKFTEEDRRKIKKDFPGSLRCYNFDRALYVRQPAGGLNPESRSNLLTLTPQQHQRICDLFRLIALEKDPERVQALAGELARLVMVQAPFREPGDQQLRIIELVAKGLKNREIAARLGMSSNVVRNHISKIYDEVGVHNRVQLALWYEVQIHERMVGYPETGQKRACGKLVERFSDLG